MRLWQCVREGHLHCHGYCSIIHEIVCTICSAPFGGIFTCSLWGSPRESNESSLPGPLRNPYPIHPCLYMCEDNTFLITRYSDVLCCTGMKGDPEPSKSNWGRSCWVLATIKTFCKTGLDQLLFEVTMTDLVLLYGWHRQRGHSTDNLRSTGIKFADPGQRHQSVQASLTIFSTSHLRKSNHLPPSQLCMSAV